MLLASSGLDPGVLSAPSRAQDGPTESTPDRPVVGYAGQEGCPEHRLTLPYPFSCRPVPHYSPVAGAADSQIWGGGAEVHCSFVIP